MLQTINFHRIIFFVAIIIYAITAFYSTGYYHADEHYQIIEFAGAKLGTNAAHEQAWEFEAASRQTIQPAICYVVFAALKIINISDPYVKALILRFITAILALGIIQFFVRTFLFSVKEKYQKVYIFLSYFLWFLPAINIRFSGETWSGLLFLLALAITQSKLYRKYFIVGAVLGLAFLFRFQTIFLSLGLVVFLLVAEKISIKNLLRIVLAGGLIQLLGIAIDTWFYGKFVVTTWEYFNKQIVEDIASEFGTEPWYFYLKEMITAPFWVFGVIIAVSFTFVLIKSPRNILIWCIIPFVLIHSLVAHKEVRFLLPLVNLIPLLIVLGFQKMKFDLIFSVNSKALKFLTFAFITIVFVLNFVALTAFSLKPAGNGKMEISHFLATKYPEKPVRLIHCSWSSPYNPFESVPTKFYQRNNVEEIRILSLCQLNDSLLSNSKDNLLILRQIELKNKRCIEVLKNFELKEIARSIPDWIVVLNLFYGEMETDDVLILYSLKHK